MPAASFASCVKRHQSLRLTAEKSTVFSLWPPSGGAILKLSTSGFATRRVDPFYRVKTGLASISIFLLEGIRPALLDAHLVAR
jgi:hypothetical protein